MKNQKGEGAWGIFLIVVVISVIALLLIKLSPSYIEYWSVKKVIGAMASDPELENMSVKDMRASFDKRASIDYITSIKGEDLDIAKDSGGAVVSAAYEIKIPLFANISACLQFSATTAK